MRCAVVALLAALVLPATASAHVAPLQTHRCKGSTTGVPEAEVTKGTSCVTAQHVLLKLLRNPGRPRSEDPTEGAVYIVDGWGCLESGGVDSCGKRQRHGPEREITGLNDTGETLEERRASREEGVPTRKEQASLCKYETQTHPNTAECEKEALST